jgi:hypothetical protein
MKRLAIALSVLLSLNLLTLGMRWLISAQVLPLATVWLTALVCVGIVALTYFSTLEASPLYAIYHREAKVYAIAGLAGVLLGLL